MKAYETQTNERFCFHCGTALNGRAYRTKTFHLGPVCKKCADNNFEGNNDADAKKREDRV